MHGEAECFYAANNYLAGNVGFQGILSRKVKTQESLYGAAIMVLRVMEISHPDIQRQQQLNLLARFISECVHKRSKRLSGSVSGMAAYLLTFLEYRGDQAAIDSLAEGLINEAEAPHGKRTIQMIMAPADPLPSRETDLLYRKLKHAIEVRAPLSEWAKDKIGDRLIRRAYSATGFCELLELASRRDRGRILTSELGF